MGTNHTRFTPTCDLWGPYFLFFVRVSAWAVRIPHILSYLFILLGGTRLLYSGEKNSALSHGQTWCSITFYQLDYRVKELDQITVSERLGLVMQVKVWMTVDRCFAFGKYRSDKECSLILKCTKSCPESY